MLNKDVLIQIFSFCMKNDDTKKSLCLTNKLFHSIICSKSFQDYCKPASPVVKKNSIKNNPDFDEIPIYVIIPSVNYCCIFWKARDFNNSCKIEIDLSVKVGLFFSVEVIPLVAYCTTNEYYGLRYTTTNASNVKNHFVYSLDDIRKNLNASTYLISYNITETSEKIEPFGRFDISEQIKNEPFEVTISDSGTEKGMLWVSKLTFQLLEPIEKIFCVEEYCVICFVNKSVSIPIRCKHVCMCISCYETWQKSCPMCRK